MAITSKQLQQLQQRVAGARRSAKAAGRTPPASPSRSHEVILGVDPSLRGTGYGVIRMHKRQPTAVAYGAIVCPAGWERSRCLLQIFKSLQAVIREHQPTVCAMEGLFFAQNLQTALIMGEARGAAMTAAAEAGLEIYEHAPRRVKQAIVGYGAAQKLAVAKMVSRMLQLADLPQPDAADALAVALTHAQETSRYPAAGAKRF